MDRLNLKLFSMVLLGALLLMMVHNIVPHTHLDQGDSHGSITHSSHHHHEHDKAHEHSDSQNSDEESEDDFLFLFFAHHSHPSPTKDIILIAQLEQTFPDKSFSFPQLFLHPSAISRDHPQRQLGICYKGDEPLYKYTFVSSGSSRAPPYLG